MLKVDRRRWMGGAGAVVAAGIAPRCHARGAGDGGLPRSARPLPLAAIRLLPSDYATAVEVNRAYLLRLSADRLLHNFRAYAGLAPKGAIYGGWESDTIAGHTLGHYMSALVLMHAQTGDETCRARADTIVGELAACQAARGSGYIGAMQRKRQDGAVVDAVEIFPEIMHGDIRSGGFDLNGAWSPLYTVHKLFAGLLDIHAAWRSPQALAVLLAFADYFATVFAALDDAQMQAVLACEYGGLNESFAELSDRTGDRKWLAIAQRLYDRKMLDPLVGQTDRLANFHANTQVPKLIGLARIYELTGRPEPRAGATFFWQAVTRHHSYVIGGNADREYFSAPDSIAGHITEQTCEHCNSYNMLKLTEHLFAWAPDGALFDYYERTHLNHVMAAQNPATAGFTYMTPLLSGAVRDYSSPHEDAFWCCVGTGMESHAKHGAAIFWEGGDTLFVNLYIPAEAQWARRRATVRLETKYPYEPETRLTLTRLGRPGQFALALRVPGWAAGQAEVEVNGAPVPTRVAGGYALVERRWAAGDAVILRLPLELRIEAAPGDPATVAFLRGPMVLAANLGPADGDWRGADPAVVGDDLLGGFRPLDRGEATYATLGVVRPADLGFVPFYKQYERRSAVYFRHFTPGAWATEEAAYVADQARLKDIAARAVDIVHLGEMQPEHDHQLAADNSWPAAYRGRNGRDARSGGYFELMMRTRPGPLVLSATYWGGESGRDFDILVDNVKIATQHLDDDKPGKFFDVEYPLPVGLTAGKTRIKVRFVPHDRSTAGPVFGIGLFTARPATTA